MRQFLKGGTDRGYGAMVETVLSVVLQHHNRLFREMLAAHLAREPDITMLGTAASGPELIQLCDLRRPTVALFEADAPRWSTVTTATILPMCW